MNFLRNKLRPLLPLLTVCIIIVALIALPFPFGAKMAHAEFFWEGITDLGGQIAAGFANSVGLVYDYLFEQIILPIMGIILGIVGLVLDAVIKLNLNSSVLRNISGITVGWTVIRDLINLSFIFILIYVAISTILQYGSYQAKNYLPKIIIAVLLINFSLFFTKIIIDAGNIIAHGFYSAVTNEGEKPLSEDFIKRTDIVRAYDPNRSLGSAVPQDPNQPKAAEENLNGATKYFIDILRAVLVGIAIYVFLSVILVFVGRIIGLTFVLMLSPIGFIGEVIPGAKSASNWWWGQLWDQTLVAPVFMVLYYLAINVIDGFSASINKVITPGGSLNPSYYLNYIIAIGLLLFVVKKTKDLGGMFGSLAQKIGSAVAAAVGTVALGAATGGSASVLRFGARAAAATGVSGAIGGKMHSIAGGEGMLGKIPGAKWAARRSIVATDRMSKAGFDIRENKAFQKTVSLAGLGEKSAYAKKLDSFGLGVIGASRLTKSFNKRQEDWVKEERAFGDVAAKKAKTEKDVRDSVESAHKEMVETRTAEANKALDARKSGLTKDLSEAEKKVASLTKDRDRAIKDKDDAQRALATASTQAQFDEAQGKTAAAEKKILDTTNELRTAERSVVDLGNSIKAIEEEIKTNTDAIAKEIETDFVASLKKATAEIDALNLERKAKEKEIADNRNIVDSQIGDTPIKAAAIAKIKEAQDWITLNEAKIKKLNEETETYREAKKVLADMGLTEGSYQDLSEKVLTKAESRKNTLSDEFKERGDATKWKNIFRDTEGNKKLAEKIRKASGKKKEDDDEDETVSYKDVEKLFKKAYKKEKGTDYKEPESEGEEGGDKKDKKGGGDKK